MSSSRGRSLPPVRPFRDYIVWLRERSAAGTEAEPQVHEAQLIRQERARDLDPVGALLGEDQEWYGDGQQQRQCAEKRGFVDQVIGKSGTQ